MVKMEDNNGRHIVRVYVGALSQEYEALSVEASKHTTADEIISCICTRLGFDNAGDYELAEVIGNSVGQDCKERRLGPFESPVALKLLWPKTADSSTSSPSPSPPNLPSLFPSTALDQYRFCLREKQVSDSLWSENFAMDPQIIKDYFYRFLYQPKDKEYPDLCQLPDLNEETLLENLRSRFSGGHIYTYVGSILIAVNPFKFHPIYNPKYVKLYQNRRREELPPHIFAIADSAYHTMLKEKRNQCIVISGESGSGKTESTNFLLHHLTALSQKGTHGSGVEQTILSAGPVLEAFGNAKTAHNNNSSRFGKFIQVSYRENGMVHGAIVQKYLLEKSRICCQAKNERNYHVFYYLLAGATDTERDSLTLLPPNNYHYLNQSGCYTLEGVDESYEFSRLKQSMEMVGFGADKQRKLFCVLSAVLLLGNVEFQPKKSSYHHDESVLVKNPQVVRQISSLLRVTEETLTAALTSKRARVSGEMLVINYRMPEAIAARDAMAKCLYGALFDWIVLQVNHALLSKKEPSGTEETGRSIGVLDIFGFEDFGNCNSFEQFCINYANEHLQQYFNQHVFKYEQEEYKREGIRWTHIDFMDNTPCLSLIEAKPNGLICILDDQCNFPGATNETLLQKINSVHKEHDFYEIPQRRETAFIIKHYAGKVKYQVMEFREKNMDLMRHDIVSVLKNSSLSFVRELVGIDPVAVFRWAILRAFFRAFFAFHEAGNRQRAARAKSMNRAFSSPGRRRSSGNDHLVNLLATISSVNLRINRIAEFQSLESNENNNTDLESHLTNSEQNNYYSKYRQARRSHYHHQHRTYFYHRPYPPPLLSNKNNNKNPQQQTLWPEDSPHVGGTTQHLHHHQNGYTTSTHTHTTTSLNQNHSNNNSHNNETCCYPPLPDYFGYGYCYMKNRSFRSQPLVTRGMKNLQSVKTLASHTASMGISNKHYNPRKQPISVSQQFQQSLHSLMITLNQANPFFIRCIKSNSDKSPNNFDDDIVQRQLGYTGMMETVRIRQAGYNVRLTFDEFIHLYRILLTKGLESSRKDVEMFLSSLTLNKSNYQLGSTKIFLREIEKVKLDYYLHQQIMSSIVAIQRWYRTALERRQFLHVRDCIIRIQSYIRMFLAQRFVSNLRMRNLAATYIQKMWKGYRVRKWYENFRNSCVQFQARIRGSLVRQRYAHILDEQRKLSKQRDKLQTVIRVRGDVDSHSGQSMDEAFLSKGSSQEELDENRLAVLHNNGDSDESSGVHEDSETELYVGPGEPYTSAPSVPPRPPRLNTNLIQTVQPVSFLSDSMPALTLSLTSKPFSLPHQNWSQSHTYSHGKLTSTSPLSAGRRSSGPSQRSDSPSPKDLQSSQRVSAKDHRRDKKKMSLKSLRGGRGDDDDDKKNVEGTQLGAYLAELAATKEENGSGTVSSKNPFHRAKKHIKTFITGSKTKLDKHEAVLLDSESETEDTLTFSSTNSSSTPSTLTLDQPLPLDCKVVGSGITSMTVKLKNDNNSRLSLDSKLKNEQQKQFQQQQQDWMLRQARSLQFAPNSISDSIPEVESIETETDFELDSQQNRFHRKIKREDHSHSLGILGRSRQDRREERKRLIAEREGGSLVGLSEDVVTTTNNSRSIIISTTERDENGKITVDRRGSGEDGQIEESDSEFRRGSRDSNQSNPSAGGSPSHSSQDSLFELNRINGLSSPLTLTQSRSYGFAPIGDASSTSHSVSVLVSSNTHNRKVHIHEEKGHLNGSNGRTTTSSSTPDFLSGRDIRRTRSVSESRQGSTSKRNQSSSTTSFASSEVSSEEAMAITTSGGPKKTGYHVLDKVTKFHRGDNCSSCKKNLHVLFAPGYKCLVCKLFFHTKCVQNGAIIEKPCPVVVESMEIDGTDSLLQNQSQCESSIGEPPSKIINGRRKYRKPSKNQTDMIKPGKFSLTGTSEFTDRTDQIISGVKELQLMQEFIARKIYQVRNKEGEKENAVDRVFQQALREFKESLVSTFSVASHKGAGAILLNIKYKDLIANFANIMETVCKHEGTGDNFPTTMGVNAFRGFLNEFMNTNRVEEKPKVVKARKERRKEKSTSKRQKVEEVINHLGHSFVVMVINIPTACEICSSFIMWPIERGVVCQKCKLACHKKCHLKILHECNDHTRSNSSGGSESGIFGASLNSLVSEDSPIPLIVEHLVTAIEFYGLRQEGLYRKSGVSSRVRELKQEIEDGKEIDWNIYPIHVLTSVLKSFFRELPEPLLTFELYDEFLRAADLSQPEDRIHTIFSILKKLPKPNYDLMERLVFHLVRVALYEDKNRMNANSLAIVLAPCILRTKKLCQVQESLSDISRQTTCLMTIISEQLKKFKTTMSNIESVDSATHSFSVRLNSIRSSKMRSPPERKKVSSGSTGSLSEGSIEKSTNESTTPESMSAEEEEEYLTRHLKHLQDEKAMLTSVLPSLSRTPSDDDMLSTDPEVDSPGGSVDDLRRDVRSPSPRQRQTRAQSLQFSKSDSLVVEAFKNSRLSPTLRLQATSPLLQNLVKSRGPLRKPPSRFVRNLAVVDFGEGEGEEEEGTFDLGGEDEDVSVQSISQENEDEAIMV